MGERHKQQQIISTFYKILLYKKTLHISLTCIHYSLCLPLLIAMTVSLWSHNACGRHLAHSSYEGSSAVSAPAKTNKEGVGDVCGLYIGEVNVTRTSH